MATKSNEDIGPPCPYSAIFALLGNKILVYFQGRTSLTSRTRFGVYPELEYPDSHNNFEIESNTHHSEFNLCRKNDVIFCKKGIWAWKRNT